MTKSLRFTKETKGDERSPFYVLENYGSFAKIGSGAYGVVCSALKTDGTKVAIKRVNPWADDEWDARHTLRELRLMRLLRGHPNIINLLDAVLGKDLFIVMELMDSDLHRIITSKQPLTASHVSCLTAQLLLGIQAMHSLGVLHRDLKPGNLLVSRSCQLRITDFGLSRYDNKNPLTEYVVTRWYRCPEVLLAPHLPYTAAVDCWSAGCIFAELIRRKPAFQGKNFVHQVQVILERLGTPADLGFVPRDDAARFLAKQPTHLNPEFAWLPATPTQKSFAAKLLTFNPFLRYDVAQALLDPYFDDLPVLPGDSKNYFPTNEGLSLAAKEFQDRVLQDKDFEFSFEDPATSLATLRTAVENDVLTFARSLQEPIPVLRRRSTGDIRTEDDEPKRRHSIPISVPDERNERNEHTNERNEHTNEHKVEHERPARSRIFGLPLLRSSKKKTRVRPSNRPNVSPLSETSTDSSKHNLARRLQLDAVQSKAGHVFSRLRSVSAR